MTYDLELTKYIYPATKPANNHPMFVLSRMEKELQKARSRIGSNTINGVDYSRIAAALENEIASYKKSHRLR